jgi:hypothetical protein
MDIVKKDFEKCLRNAKNKNEDIPQFISTIASGDNKIKYILKTMNLIMDCKNKMENGGNR